ncbi:MAG: C45 family autoproteolytic acyltransferase/hydrolase [Pseudomonadota bacterium]
MSDEILGLENAPETLADGEGRAQSALYRLSMRGQPFYLLKQRGAFADMTYDQGRLLAKEIHSGAFPEIVATIRKAQDLENPTVRALAGAIYRAYSGRVLDNVSGEFRAAIEGLLAGYRNGIGQSGFSDLEVRDALVAIEVGNLVEGLTRCFALPDALAARLPGVLALALPLLGDDEAAAYRDQEDADEKTTRQALGQGLKAMTGPNARIDFACTGFSVPRGVTACGRHLHARNLDADLYNWNKAPVLYLVDETPENAAWHRYAAFGTAGLIYPGGISGLNDAGIAASLHQMSTTNYESGFLFGHGDIAPFVQQRVLREAGSLDEAAEIIEDSKHFAAWTIFCSDAKTGETQRFEFNGDKVRAGLRTGQPVAQTNHFLDPDLQERRFDEDDGHFTPTLGKWLETHVRYNTTTEALENNRGRIDVDWAIDWLAASQDWALEQIAGEASVKSARSYGRVSRKVYGQLGSIVLADPERQAGRDEVWMTTGDASPSPHSSYAGWRVDWEAFEITPVADTPLRRTAHYVTSGRANWERSLTLYVDARLAVARPRDEVGALIARRASEDESAAHLSQAIEHLGGAIKLAAEDRIVEVPYHFMRARLRHEVGDHDAARYDWDLLRDIWDRQNGGLGLDAVWPVDAPLNGPTMHPSEAALTLLLSTVTEDWHQESLAWPGRAERLEEAKSLLRQLKVDLFGEVNPGHFAIADWLHLLEEVAELGGQGVELPEPNFVTVE